MNIVSDEEEQLSSNTGLLAHLQELLNEVRELKYKTELTNDELQQEKLSNAANNDSLQKDIRNLQNQMNALEEAKAELTDDVSELKQELLRNQQEENSTTMAPAASSRGLSARHRPSLRALPSFLFQRHVTTHDGLPMDTFALMMTSPPRSQAWFLGILAFAFQMVLVCMIATDQLQESIMSSHFNVPFKVESTVRAGQFFAIIFALATQTDITTSIRLIVMFWNDPNWGKTILQHDESAPPPTNAEWRVHIAVPNVLKLMQGILVTMITIVVIVQSENTIDLFKDFAALMVLSETDNIFFGLAASGYLGSELHRRAIEAQEIELKYEVNESEDSSGGPHAPSTSTHDKDFLIRSIILFVIAIVMIGGWLYIVINQVTGVYFFRKYPGCNVTDAFELASEHFGDGVCFGGALNTLECEFEGEDCVNFNLAFPLCRGDNRTNVQMSLGNGICEKKFMNSDCAYDGGDCCPDTIINDPSFGDGHCDERMNTVNCGYDDGDCIEYNRDFSGCPYDVVFRNPSFGDGRCNGGIASTKYCAYDNNDCDIFIRTYPDCPINDLAKIEGANDAVMGDGVCNSGIYRIEECGYEFGDCKHFQVGQTVSITDGAESNDRLDFSMILSLNGKAMALGMEYFSEDGTDVYSDGRGLARILSYDDNRMMWIQLGSDIVGSQTTRNDDNFGQRLSLSSNGNRIVVSSASEAQIYYFNSTSGENWKQVGQTIISSVTYPNAFMSADGSKVALIHSEDEIRIYNFPSNPSINDHIVTIIPGGGLTSDTRLELNSLDSSRLLVLNDDNVVAKVYQFVPDPTLKSFFPDTTPKSWIQIGKDIGGRFPAASSAMSADGNRIAVSFHATSIDAPGQVNVFDYNTMTDEWVLVGEPIKSSSAINSDDGFGYSIHLSSDGDLLVIGSNSPKCQDGTNRLFAINECTTGYAAFYFVHPDSNRFHKVIPKSTSSYKANGNILNLADFEQSDNRISGLHFSLSGDGMALSISSYDFDDRKAFIEVYDIDELFYTSIVGSKGWRLWVSTRNSVSPGAWDVAEIEFYASPDCSGDKIPNTGTVVDSAHANSNYVPSNAFGNDFGIWGGRRDIDGFYHIGMMYSNEVTVGCVKVWNDQNWATRELTIQATNKNGHWEDIHVAKDLDISSYAMNTIAIYL